MNYRTQNEYCCDYYWSDEKTFTPAVDHLIDQIRNEKKISRLVFFGTTTDQTYETDWKYIKQQVGKYFTKNPPLVTYVAQPVLGDSSYAVEIHYLRNTPVEMNIKYKTFEDVQYQIIDSDDRKSVLIEGVKSNLSYSVRKQSDEIFRKIEMILLNENMQIEDIVRQWNYIGRITAIENDIQNYQAFNDARSVFYNKANWNKHGYPAATGIGMDCAGVIVELIATRHKNDAIKIAPVDNPMQIAAHKYSQQVLIGKYDERLCGKSTPKFERAKAVSCKHGYTCFVSGTAALRGEESLTGKSCGCQTDMTIENIELLISGDNLKRYGISVQYPVPMDFARVYIKNPEEYKEASESVNNKWKEVKALYVKADVCRDELLVEIEGMASSRFYV
ncbi:MAG: hypothetical protein ACRCX5_04625 [Bacteroidales bacterium]